MCFPRRGLLVFFFVCVVAFRCIAGDSTSTVRSEIDRLKQFASIQKADEPLWKDVKPQVDRFLALADQSLQRGDIYFAVEELGKANELVLAYQATSQNPDTLKQGLAGFESVWQKSRLELITLDQQNAGRRWSNTPAAIRALAESEQGQVMTLLAASRAYASVTEPQSGYFYLGQAKSKENFSAFVANLALTRKGTPYEPRSIAFELQQLQDKVNAAFVPPRSIEKHPQFIRLNSTLKTAEELDTAKLYAGAMYQYLQAVVLYELLDAPDVDAPAQEKLRQDLAASRKKIAVASQDDSIAQLFLERAETLISKKGDAAPTKDEWRNAAAVLSAALPAYYSVRKAPADKPHQQQNLVTVTLVRWPYT